MANETVIVPVRADGQLKHDILDILVMWQAGKFAAGVAYERIVARAALNTQHREG